MPDPKRERQRQNREAARAAQLEAARQQRKRQSLIRGTVGFVLIIGLFVLFAALHSSGSGKKKTDTSAATSTTATSEATTSTTENPALAAVQCNDTKPAENANRPTFTTAPPMTIDTNKKYTAVIETSCGKITADLDAKGAPKTVNNFVFLAQKHFYDGLTWHRVVKDFVIQGGDPQGTGTGGPGYQFEDELPTDGYKLGSLAMANSGPNTNGSQFFIVTGQNGTSLPNSYSRFGMVTGGLEVAQKLESFATADPNGKPSRPLYILSITINVS
ncbi:MAG TPA: peptidylprolyl isomerase [Acidimicrobiia bacterium]|nr:peptidylprolyl isomerase [Acidimicrobiia bacterium]